MRVTPGALAAGGLALALLVGPAGAQNGELADPTRPPSVAGARPPAPKPAPPTEWVLTLVKFSAAQRSAVVNGRVVREGGHVGGARVIAIERDAVILQYEGRRLRVALQRPAVKARAGAR